MSPPLVYLLFFILMFDLIRSIMNIMMLKYLFIIQSSLKISILFPLKELFKMRNIKREESQLGLLFVFFLFEATINLSSNSFVDILFLFSSSYFILSNTQDIRYQSKSSNHEIKVIFIFLSQFSHLLHCRTCFMCALLINIIIIAKIIFTRLKWIIDCVICFSVFLFLLMYKINPFISIFRFTYIISPTKLIRFFNLRNV